MSAFLNGESALPNSRFGDFRVWDGEMGAHFKDTLLHLGREAIIATPEDQQVPPSPDVREAQFPHPFASESELPPTNYIG